MLIATRKNGKGHIVEFTSADLKEWESAGTFMTMMWDRFYECPDVFNVTPPEFLNQTDKLFLYLC